MRRVPARALSILFASLLSAFIFAMPACAAAEEKDDKELEEVKKKIEVLSEEIEKLKLGGVAGPAYESYGGLGPAASKVYFLERGLSIGGYGEVVYSNYLDSTKNDQADAFRFILYTGYKFTDSVVMNAELEFEHTNEVSAEFVYADLLLAPAFKIRAGLMLVPIGLINEFHEPTVYHGVLRPEVERNIIPTTWRDIGVMAYGGAGGLSYRAAVLNGLRSDRFASGDWIRGGRYNGNRARADVPAFIAGADYELVDGMRIGGTYYNGEAGEGRGGDQAVANEKEATVELWEVHASLRYRGFGARGLYVAGSLDGSPSFETAPPGGVGKSVKGYYAEASYDVLQHLTGRYPDASLEPFVRYEWYDTQDEVFSGAPDPALERKITTVGISLKPIPNLVIKADYQVRDTASGLAEGKGTGLDENKIDQVNLGLGFIF